MKDKFTLVLLIVFCLSLNAQSGNEKYYYDLGLDYFPMIQYRMSPNSNIGVKVTMNGELVEVLYIYLRKLLEYDFCISRIDGMRMLSGTMPQDLMDNIWVSLKFDFTGRVIETNVYYGVTLNESLSEGLFKMLLDSKFLPALKNGEPVSSSLYYLVKKRVKRQS